MELISKFFWLFGGVWVGVGNALYFRVRLSRAVRDGAITQREVDRFTLGAVGWQGGPCLALWIVQVFLAEGATPDFRSWEAPYATIGSAICIFILIASFVWIWFRGGDQKLARIYTLARHQAFLWGHPITFRIVSLLAIGVGVIGMFLLPRGSNGK